MPLRGTFGQVRGHAILESNTCTVCSYMIKLKNTKTLLWVSTSWYCSASDILSNNNCKLKWGTLLGTTFLLSEAICDNLIKSEYCRPLTHHLKNMWFSNAHHFKIAPQIQMWFYLLSYPLVCFTVRYSGIAFSICCLYSETCVREPPLRQTLNSEGWCGKVTVL